VLGFIRPGFTMDVLAHSNFFFFFLAIFYFILNNRSPTPVKISIPNPFQSQTHSKFKPKSDLKPQILKFQKKKKKKSYKNVELKLTMRLITLMQPDAASPPVVHLSDYISLFLSILYTLSVSLSLFLSLIILTLFLSFFFSFSLIVTD
jgi:hypothetical protein